MGWKKKKKTMNKMSGAKPIQRERESGTAEATARVTKTTKTEKNIKS